MRLDNLTEKSSVYTCNVYLIRGDWNSLQDQNTLVDVGRDPGIFEELENISTGLGKKKVDQVVLTHTHSDHAGLIQEVRSRFEPQVLAFSEFCEGIDRVLQHGDILQMGDEVFEVIHAPGHSSDSICLFCARNGVLFSGDTQLSFLNPQGNHHEDFIMALKYLASLEVKSVYPGHGPPIQKNAAAMIRSSARMFGGDD
ncbi:MBL fold metallo-hydrolase [Desulfonatronospira sp.]|uniref:MBL fold metallo-hydrolase n=1 Tax=Desulfonatronospira sp. TaxID=1962951 RepID=UPI0025BB04AB|nr:MBL fold metallo-hydrolase [Desulfonatronospira sp.]